ncbi:hypothetical protein N7451_006388 [Penicillium sp. IBT 35674x]|nr:hypothetical protein N7451_006388 [Penicillium sp. IBT 35674x]
MESVILPKAFARIAFWVLQTPTRTSIAGMEFITDGSSYGGSNFPLVQKGFMPFGSLPQELDAHQSGSQNSIHRDGLGRQKSQDCKLISLAIGTCLKISAEMSK